MRIESKRGMRILVVSQYYLPENAHISSSVAAGLSVANLVQVLTSFPNYPQGRVYEGYSQRWRQRDEISGIPVLRVPMYMDHSQSAIRRILNYLTFGISSATAFRYGRRADVIYVYATQMTAAFGPWLWRLFGGAPYVLHVQDLWPDSITGSSMVKNGVRAKVINAVLRPWLRSVYKHSGAVICIAPNMVEALASRGVSREKLHLVYNWARDVGQPSMNRDNERNGVVAIFAGNVGDMQDLTTVVRAAHRVIDTGLRVRIVGSGVALSEVRKIADQIGATNIEFWSRVEPEEMASVYADADFSLVTLKDLPVFRSTIPSKFQASLAHGIPIITTVKGNVSEIVQEHCVGFVADPENVDSLELSFREAVALSVKSRAEMAERAADLYTSSFSAESALEVIEEVLSSVVELQMEG